jgi:type IV pilus assembly protein PilO
MTALIARVRAGSRAMKLATALVALGLAGVAGAVLFLAPARARTAALASRATALQAEIAAARRAVADLERDRRQRVELEGRLRALQGTLPAEREMAALYRSTYEAASSTGLAVSLFQPRDARQLDSYAEIPISLTAEGTYHQLGRFLERLAGFSRVVTVTALRMSRIERPAASLRAEMTLATYVYRPAGTPPPAAATAAPSTAPSGAPARPASPAVPAVHRTRATAWQGVGAEPAPLSAHGYRDPFESGAPSADNFARVAARPRPVVASAMLTGIVRGREGPLALVETQDGHGHVLRPGEVIDEARLLRIDGDTVVFEIPAHSGLPGERIVLPLGQVK